eukprot:768561-Hanusia_phi.AAC.3
MKRLVTNFKFRFIRYGGIPLRRRTALSRGLSEVTPGRGGRGPGTRERHVKLHMMIQNRH